MKEKEIPPFSNLSIGVEPITIREEDAFRMKAISLIRSHNIPFRTISEAFQAVRNTPIQSKVDASVVTLEQRFSPFPGETIILKGAFQRNPGIPITDSFKLFSETNQTGFPYPQQHTGWALSNALIPDCPFEIIQEKRQIAQELMTPGPLLTKAKELLAKKEKLPEELFQPLFRAITTAAGKPNIPYPENFISDCESFNQKFIEAPLKGIELVEPNTPYEKIIFEACKNIALKQSSNLSLFEKKLLACAFKQLREFHKELKSGVPNNPRKQLEEEISLFLAESIDYPSIEKLEEHFSGCPKTS